MTCTYLVSNNSNIPTSEIINLFDGEPEFSEAEKSNLFVRVVITDKNKSDLEYTLDPLLDTSQEVPFAIGNKWHFIIPEEESSLRLALREYGIVRVTFDQAQNYLEAR